MSQTLLISSDSKSGSLLSLNLLIHTSTNVIWKEDVHESLEVIKLLPTLGLIIVDNEDTTLLSGLIHFMEEMDRKVPIIFIGKENLDCQKEKIFCVELAEDITPLIKLASEKLGVSGADHFHRVLPNFFPIPISTFFLLERPRCDLYIRMESVKESHRFLKRVAKNDPLDSEMLERYQDKGINFLYVLKEDRFMFTEGFTDQVLEQLRGESITQKQRVVVTESAYQLAKENFVNLNFNEETMGLVEEGIKSIKKLCKKNESKFSDLLENLLSDETSYQFQHIVVTNYLCFKAIKRVGWVNTPTGLAEHMKKLSQVCFFHDIVLPRDELVKVHSLECLGRARLEQEDKELILNHAKVGANLVRNIKSINDDVASIIMQHHGTQNGVGFSHELNSSLLPLTHIFMACEVFCSEIIAQRNQKPDFEKVVEKLPAEFLKKDYWKVISLLK